MITPKHYLLLCSFLFVTGTLVVATRKQPLIVLMGTGLMLSAVNLAVAALTSWFQDWSGQVAALVVATLTVAEIAVGFSFALAQMKIRGRTR